MKLRSLNRILFTLLGLGLAASTPAAQASGITEKDLAVNLTFDPLPPNLTNFDLKGFTVSDGSLIAYGTLAGTVEGNSVTTAFAVPVTGLDANCAVVSLDLGPVSVNFSGLTIEIRQVGFDVVALPTASSAVQSLTCTIGHLVGGGGNSYALAAALNRMLPAVQ